MVLENVQPVHTNVTVIRRPPTAVGRGNKEDEEVRTRTLARRNEKSWVKRHQAREMARKEQDNVGK